MGVESQTKTLLMFTSEDQFRFWDGGIRSSPYPVDTPLTFLDLPFVIHTRFVGVTDEVYLLGPRVNR